jgi:hypothetical protein
MATPIQELVKWLDEINNSIWALTSSKEELKMISGFKKKAESLLQKEREMVESAYKDAMLTGYSCSEINERYEDIIFNGQKAEKLMDPYIDNLFKTEV